MDIKLTLEMFCQYFQSTRGVGHSRAAIQGIRNSPDAIFIAHDRRTHLSVLKSLNHEHSLNLHGIELGDLNGHHRPIVFDNYALHVLFAESLAELNRLEGEVKTLGERLAASDVRPHGKTCQCAVCKAKVPPKAQGGGRH